MNSTTTNNYGAHGSTTNEPVLAPKLSAEQDSAGIFNTVAQSLKSFATFSEILRIVGALILLASMSLFLMQGWTETNDFHRHGMMLAQTFLLGCAGFCMYKLLSDNKSARLFFSLGLISITVNFTTLGAMMYSVFSWDKQVVDYPSFAHWVAGDVSVLGLATVSALLILVPLAWFGFAILSRASAKPLTMWYIGLNLLLLLPLRTPEVMVVLVSVAALLLIKMLKQQSAHTTLEARFARAIVFLPLLIMLVRSLFFYQLTELTLLVMAVTAYLILRQTGLLLKADSMIRRGTEIVSVFIAGFVALQLSEVVFSALIHSEYLMYLRYLRIPVTAIVFSMMCFDLWRRTSSVALQTAFMNLASSAVLLGFAFNQLFYENLFTAFSGITVGMALVYFGYLIRSRYSMLMGASLFLGIVVTQCGALIEMLFSTGWLGLAVTGASIIVIAALVDRYGAIIQLKWTQSQKRFAAE
ncbi:MAG: hypothetical protein ACRBHB_06150 [Arenicella sp.]